MQDQHKCGRMAADVGDCVLQVVSAFSDENLCVLHLPSSSMVLDIKRHVQASHGISIFRQRLLVLPAGHQVDDHEVLAALPGIRLQLIRLEYADDDADGLCCLLRAAGEGKAPEVERLLKLPLRPDCSQAEDGVTALILASENGHQEVARLLCEAGADKDKARQGGATALIWASIIGHLELARLLCEAGADKDKARQDGVTALVAASEGGHLEVARLLCEAVADEDKARPDDATALMVASEGGLLQTPGPQPCFRSGLDAMRRVEKQNLSNATCLIRPHLFDVVFVAARISIICQIIRCFEETSVRQVVLDK